MPTTSDTHAGTTRVELQKTRSGTRDARGETVPAEVRPAERAYAGIRTAILDGVLQPGEHLREEPLAAMTGTSRTPVREALRRLVVDGLATAVDRHRYVTHFPFEEVAVVFDVRARLEGYAAQLAAQQITREEVGQLKRTVDEIDRVFLGRGGEADRRFGDLNAAFHRTIIQATRSQQLSLLIAPTLALPLDLIKRHVWEQPLGIERSNQQHRDIIAALESGDGQWAAASMSNHILSRKPVAGRTHPVDG